MNLSSVDCARWVGTLYFAFKQTKRVDRSDRRDLSLFQRGWRYLFRFVALNRLSELKARFSWQFQSDYKTLTLPAPKEFLWQYVHSTPLVAMVAKVDEEALAAFERDVVKKWQDFEEDGSLMYQQRIVGVSARK